MTRTKREIAYRSAGALILAAAVVPWATSGSAVATNYGGDDKVTICHATSSTTNPYEKITVAKSAVDGSGGGDHYRQHTGPVFTPGMKNGWGDIIPPVAPYHSGLNWDSTGKSIYNTKDCSLPTVCPTATVTATATVTKAGPTTTVTKAGPTQTVTQTKYVSGPTETVTKTKTVSAPAQTVTSTQVVTVTPDPITTTATVTEAGPTSTVKVTETLTITPDPVTTTMTATERITERVTETQTATTEVPGPTQTVTETVTETATTEVPGPTDTVTETVTETATESSTATETATETANATQTVLVSQTDSMQAGDPTDSSTEVGVLGTKAPGGAGGNDGPGVLAETGTDGMTQKLVLSAALLMIGFALFAAPELLGAARTTMGRRH
jgi:hypothetical protein